MLDPDIEAIVGPRAQPPVSTGDQAIGAYEAGDRFDRALASWLPAIRSADGDLLPEKELMDARVRDMDRNDAFVANGQQIHRDSIVGSMFLLNAKPETAVLGKSFDDKWAEEFQTEVEAKFTTWAESPSNWPDISRTNTLTALTRLVVGTYTLAGEALATVEWDRDVMSPFRTAVQMVDLDRLSNPYDEMPSDRLRGGIEMNRAGKAIAYHIRMAHPNDWDYRNGEQYTWKRVPAAKPWGRPLVIHIMEQMRVDQTRGVAAMVTALKEMKITKKYRDIVLQNAVLNATYAASIESDMPPDTVFAQIGGGNVKPEAAITSYAKAWLSAINAYAGNSRHMQIDGLKIPHLFPGTKLQLRNAATPGGIGEDFESSLIRYIAAALGVSYEALSKNYSNTNYSSIRAANTETWKYMQSKKRIVAERFAGTVYRLWLEEAIMNNRIDSLPVAYKNPMTGWLYEPLVIDAIASCEWIGAARGQIEELKETQAAVLRVKNNLSTLEDELGRQGKDWRKVLKQRRREMAILKEYDLVPPEDNMINAASGAPRESSGDGEAGAEEKSA